MVFMIGGVQEAILKKLKEGTLTQEQLLPLGRSELSVRNATSSLQEKGLIKIIEGDIILTHLGALMLDILEKKGFSP